MPDITITAPLAVPIPDGWHPLDDDAIECAPTATGCPAAEISTTWDRELDRWIVRLWGNDGADVEMPESWHKAMTPDAEGFTRVAGMARAWVDEQAEEAKEGS